MFVFCSASQDSDVPPSGSILRLRRQPRWASCSNCASKDLLTNRNAAFIEPMLLVRTDRLPDDLGGWSYELKFDGYRAVAF